ncbi:NAD(P)-binding protein [Aaosphaeria arxii CBS 175.79]|uniref:NAD(P)-binding protein n=1 Tax=Aaosphaeria arxii CBS 175.79 TaxID=1450172 RepID=A0A6A5XNC2_9PLEO|nr:NAD(P)-binding protein [Aaosphaeria arxii CBS 175.79]KAF2014389.1 NAD(P)-binding protein [Aaosphaeria arxii CBS 175.79]
MAFAEAGVEAVAFADVNLDSATAAATVSKAHAASPNYHTIALHIDVQIEDSVRACMEAVVRVFGRMDYCVNSAGIGVNEPMEISEASLVEFDRFYQINVRGVLLCTREASRIMKAQGRKTAQGRSGPKDAGRGAIVNVGSASSYVATPSIVQYTASKHALLGITRNAALDNSTHGIRVNAVCPSWVQTPMMARVFEATPEFEDMINRVVPLGRIAQPEEVSDLIVFLSSPKASYITGQGYIVDGGATLAIRT